jgi:hypothetical protein
MPFFWRCVFYRTLTPEINNMVKSALAEEFLAEEGLNPANIRLEAV